MIFSIPTSGKLKSNINSVAITTIRLLSPVVGVEAPKAFKELNKVKPLQQLI
jgi:hypothetical protein